MSSRPRTLSSTPQSSNNRPRRPQNQDQVIIAGAWPQRTQRGLGEEPNALLLFLPQWLTLIHGILMLLLFPSTTVVTVCS